MGSGRRENIHPVLLSQQDARSRCGGCVGARLHRSRSQQRHPLRQWQDLRGGRGVHDHYWRRWGVPLALMGLNEGVNTFFDDDGKLIEQLQKRLSLEDVRLPPSRHSTLTKSWLREKIRRPARQLDWQRQRSMRIVSVFCILLLLTVYCFQFTVLLFTVRCVLLYVVPGTCT